MKFKIKAKYIKKALEIADKFRNDRTPVPALVGYLFDVKEDVIIITASDLDAAVRITLKNGECFKTEATGTAIFPAKIKAITAACDSEYITVDAPETMAVVKYGGSRFKLSLSYANDYPRISFDENGVSFSADKDEISGFVKSVSFVAAKNSTRPALEGINLKLSDGVLEAAATDGYRVGVNDISVDAPAEAEGSILVHAKAMERLASFPNSAVTFFMSNRLCFKGEDDDFAVEAMVRAIDATFPDILGLMSKEGTCQREFLIRKDVLSAATDRASLFAGDDHHVVTFDLDPDKCSLSAQSLEIGSSSEELADCSYIGEGGSYSFDLRYVRDVLKNVKDKGNVKVKFMGDFHPAYFSIGEDTGRYVILPVRTL